VIMKKRIELEVSQSTLPPHMTSHFVETTWKQINHKFFWIQSFITN
jgi:hypothetical protein